MDPNRWPIFMWLAVAVGFGSVVASIGLLLWKGLFRRRKGWARDSISLGASGFALVVLMMGYLIVSDGILPKELQKFVGYFALGGLAILLTRLCAISKRGPRDRGRRHD